MFARQWTTSSPAQTAGSGCDDRSHHGAAVGLGTPSQAATQGPCDIYAAGGTPCVAAHSTTRALYGAYNGNLYQVRRSSDNTTLNIGVLSAGGYANAAAQDSFCSGTTCVITVIYDQSGRGNNLTEAPAGGAAGGPDNLANATAAPTTLNGHKAYGVYVAAGTGYRDNSTNGIATGNNPEGEYAIFDGTHYNGGCCFDYGNAETDSHDDGNGTMEAIYFGNIKVWGFGTGNGPWIMADMENGLYSGVNAGLNSADPTINYRYTTAMIKGGANLLGDQGRQRPVRQPVHLLQRSPAERLRLQPDEEAGRHHPRHRRRQQQRRRRHLLRRRHDLRLPVRRHRERRPGQHRRRRLRHAAARRPVGSSSWVVSRAGVWMTRTRRRRTVPRCRSGTAAAQSNQRWTVTVGKQLHGARQVPGRLRSRAPPTAPR